MNGKYRGTGDRQVQEKDWQGECPKCREGIVKQVLPRRELGGIAMAIESFRCVDCGCFVDIVPDYDCW
jgi:hypothetical protein